MTTLEAPSSISGLTKALEAARAELADAEAAEIAASEAVDRAREGHALGRILRAAMLTTQRSLADRQEATELARARIRALDRELLAAREAADRERERAAAQRGVALRAAGALLAGQFHAVLSRFLDDLEELEQEAKRFNAQGDMPSLYRLRPPSDYPVLNGRLIDAAQQFLTVYPPSPTTTKNGG